MWGNPTIAGDPADHVAARAELRAAFSRLPAELRLTVMLVDREGYDYVSTAAILGVPIGTVASRVSRARLALQSALDAPASTMVSRVAPTSAG